MSYLISYRHVILSGPSMYFFPLVAHLARREYEDILVLRAIICGMLCQLLNLNSEIVVRDVSYPADGVVEALNKTVVWLLKGEISVFDGDTNSRFLDFLGDLKWALTEDIEVPLDGTWLFYGAKNEQPTWLGKPTIRPTRYLEYHFKTLERQWSVLSNQRNRLLPGLLYSDLSNMNSTNKLFYFVVESLEMGEFDFTTPGNADFARHFSPCI